MIFSQKNVSIIRLSLSFSLFKKRFRRKRTFVIKIPGTGGGFGANGSDGGVDGTFGVELILKCIMCITSKVFYETMIK